jgi:hypothetical protein
VEARRGLIVGILLSVAALLQPVMAHAIEPSWAGGLAAAMAAELVTGREAAIPFALAVGVPAAWIALTSILQNLALAALIAPAASAGIHAAEARAGFWGRFLHNLHAGAARQVHQGRNAWALFGFMLLPFVANGAVIAAIIGTLAGLAERRLVAVIVSAVAITATAWSYGYALLVDALAAVHPALRLVPALGAFIVIGAWLALALVRARRERA